jgi:histidinol-phosphatase (PHP family)
MDYSSYHNHTTYCDGKNTAEDMVLAAIAKGCKYFGISEHSHTSVPFDVGNLTSETTREYLAEMRGLREKYTERITILTGIEQDALGDLPTDGADYVIGSTHFVCPGGDYRYVDDNEAGQRETIYRCYGGDKYAFAEDYFALESQVAVKTNADIIGHFDLINKNNEGERVFDTSHPRYRAAAIDSMTEILKTCRLFEVNTGAMYRVGRSEQYPQTWLLRELQARGGEVILSGDSHDCASIGYKFDEMAQLLRTCGFRYRMILTDAGFARVAL